MDTTDGTQGPGGWPGIIYGILRSARVRQVGYVPDSGHTELIRACNDDPDIACISLTSEEEGIGLLSGAWLGGQSGALLMQSSGVGNCVNAIASITRACQFPLLMLITMRGEWGEGNPWQVPMGRAVEPVLEALGVQLARVEKPADVPGAVSAMASLAFKSTVPAAVILSQRLIGAKSFQD